MKSRNYIKAIKNLNVPEDMKLRIRTRALNANHSKVKENLYMFKRKIICTAAAAALIVGVVACAASGIITSRYASSSSIPDYKSLPSAEKCVKDAGYAPILIESFENGYSFKDGVVKNNKFTDENNKVLERFKSFSFEYEKDGSNINFEQEKYASDNDISHPPIACENGVNIYSSVYKNKFVPADYEMTEEDKEAEKSGELIFSYGTDTVEISTITQVTWQIGDMHYCLWQNDDTLSVDELTAMAKEAINK